MSINIPQKTRLLLSGLLLIVGIIFVFLNVYSSDTAHVYLAQKQSASQVVFDRYLLSIRGNDNSIETQLIDLDEKGKVKNIDVLNKALIAPLKIVGTITDNHNSEVNKTPSAQTPQEVEGPTQETVHGGSQGKTLALNLKSPMFDQNLDLSEAHPDVTLGPIQFRLVNRPSSTDSAVPQKKSNNPANKAAKGEGTLLILDATNGKLLQAIPHLKVGTTLATVNGAQISLTNIYEQALVIDNKMGEGGQPGANPALEIQIVKGKEKLREIAYALHPEFSMIKTGAFGMKFTYELKGTEKAKSTAKPTPVENDKNLNDDTIPAGHFVEINIADANQGSIDVALYKDKKFLKKQVLRPNEQFVTPWMQAVLTLKSIASSTPTEASQAHLSTGGDLSADRPEKIAQKTHDLENTPSHSIKLELADATLGEQTQRESLTLTPDEQKTIRLGDKSYEVALTQLGFILPFTMRWADDTTMNVYSKGVSESVSPGGCLSIDGYSIHPTKTIEGALKVEVSHYQLNYWLFLGITALIGGLFTALFTKNQD